MEQNRIVRLLICTLCSLVVLASCHSYQGTFYRIEVGDTFWKVAHSHDVEVEDLLRANPRTNMDSLKPGQRIFVPGIKDRKVTYRKKLNTEQWIPKQSNQPTKTVAERKKIDDSRISDFRWPYHGTVIYPFGMRNQKMHNGLDIQIPAKQSIKASYSGKVVYVGDGIEGYDQVVILLHGDHFFTIYAYLGEVLVQKDQNVKTGEVLAKSRDSNPSFFHFEIRYVKTALDPMRYLK